MWKPKYCCKYWLLSPTGVPFKQYWVDEDWMMKAYNAGNVFKSRKEATNFAKLIKSLRDNETLTKLMRGVR